MISLASTDMSTPRSEIKNGALQHFSVGAIIEREGKYLLIDRVNIPLGFAAPAGHIDEGETPEEALVREVKEEVNLDVKNCTLLTEELVLDNLCTRGVKAHYWYVFSCETTGEPVRDEEEAKSMGWYTPEEMEALTLEPVWEYWFKKLKII